MDSLKDLMMIYEDINTPQGKYVVVIRGTSGSGKSTFASLFDSRNSIICTADDFFYDQSGKYNFDPSKLGDAHRTCQNKFECALQDPKVKTVIVANTNVKPSDYKYYMEKSAEYGAKYISVVLEKRHDNVNVHSVPDHVLQRQHDALKNDLKLM
jgi:predicted kinase